MKWGQAMGRYEESQTLHDPHHDVMPLGFDPTEAIAAVTKVTRENPHAALAGAAAVGFILGGGLTPKFMGAIAMFAARRYFRATVEETLAAVQSTLEGQHRQSL
jgi:hypothetical protein